MARRIFVFSQLEEAHSVVARDVIRWCLNHPRSALGGATGQTPIPVWREIWWLLATEYSRLNREIFLDRRVLFLDEYVGPVPIYWLWARQQLRVNQGGFIASNVFLPQASWYKDGQPVDSHVLKEILSQTSAQYVLYRDQKGQLAGICIPARPADPTLQLIKASLDQYEQLLRDNQNRLQMLGLGKNGHLGFVEPGTADPTIDMLLTCLASSTCTANTLDSQITTIAGEVNIGPLEYAVTQALGAILAAQTLLVIAGGLSKAKAVKQMVSGEETRDCAAPYIRRHSDVWAYVDRDAFSQTSPTEAQQMGWEVIMY